MKDPQDFSLPQPNSVSHFFIGYNALNTNVFETPLNHP
jgi:hypothetical protein